MKICFLGNAQSVHIQRWMQYFVDQGHDIHLITLKQSEDTSNANIKIYPLDVKRRMAGIPLPSFARKLSIMSVVKQIKNLLNTIQPDILHAHSVTDNGFFGSLSNFHPYVVTAWGSDILIAPQRSIIYKKIAQYALKKADALTCDADHMVDSMEQLYRSRHKNQVIFFGTDIHKYHPEQKDSDFAAELGFPPSSPIIISVRRLAPIYDIETLIRAVPLVLEQVPDTKFVIGGDGEQQAYLEELSQSLGIVESIRFVGSLQQNELPRYVASSDIYVSTALSDAGLSASTAEAMACELPVVITDFGDNGEWVTNDEGGFLVPLQSPDALGSRLVHLLQNPEKRKQFGSVNRRIIEERNNYYIEMAKVENLYQRLIEEHTL